MRFVALPRVGVMQIDNQVLAVNTAGVAGVGLSVGAIFFNSDDGTGNIEYADRPKLLNRDVTPISPVRLESLINLWLNAALTALPTLTLQQARNIKIGLVDALFNHHRRTPISIDQLPGQSWDTDDDSVKIIKNQIAVHDVAPAIQQAASNVGASASASVTPTVSTFLHVGGWPTTPEVAILTASAITQLYAAVNFSVSIGTVSISTGPNISIIPRGSTALQAVSMVNAKILIREISARRQRFNNQRNNRKQWLNVNDTTIPQVIARNVTDDWGS